MDQKPPIIILLLLTVIVTLAVGMLIFPLVAWLYPVEDYSEYSTERAIRFSISLFMTMLASNYLQRRIWKLMKWKVDD
jgi:hypothetical protein